MYRKLLATFALASLLGLSLLQSVALAEFSDISDLHPNAAAINSLVDQEILLGYEDGSFKPDQAVTRAEAVKIVLLGMEVAIDEESISGVIFSDVDESDWFYDYVSTAVNLGIVKGYDDGTFLPHQTVNRAEALKILTLAADELTEIPDNDPFVDVNSELWFAPYAAYSKDWNVEPPQEDGLWHAADDMTRANISELVYRMQITQTDGTAFDESTNWATKRFPTVDLTLKVPFGWDLKGDGVGAVWTLDTINGQFSLLSPQDNGATLLMTRYSNTEGASSSELFRQIEAGLNTSYLEDNMNGYPSLTVFVNNDHVYREWYVVLDNGSMVHFQALSGDGAYSPFLEEYMTLIVRSVNYSPSSEVDPVEAAMSAIQVDGVGQDTMDLFSDLILIETDAIGVGTGPVDYFYSPSRDITIKYERSFDVILDVQEGEITAF